MSDLSLDAITAPYYHEAEKISILFTDFAMLPFSPYNKIVRRLFKACGYELKFALRLNCHLSKEDYKAAMKALKRQLKVDTKKVKERRRKPSPPTLQSPTSSEAQLPPGQSEHEVKTVPAQPLPPGTSEQTAEPVAIIPSLPAKP